MTRSSRGLLGVMVMLVPVLLAWGCDSSVSASDDDGTTGCGDPPPPSTGECPPAWACIDGSWVDTSAGDCVTPCPEARPAENSPCAQLDMQCGYWVDDEPCGQPAHEAQLLCTGDGWVTLGPRCSPPLECPPELPQPSEPCDGASQSLCAYTVTTACGEVMATASCDYATSGTWTVEIEPCGPCETLQDAASCSATAGCRWLVPGCGELPVPAEGCFPAEDCIEGGCDEGTTCSVVTYNPCWNSRCDACGAEAMICLANDG